jgi:pimeloyl-ACP methyl ester carboxylesterase
MFHPKYNLHGWKVIVCCASIWSLCGFVEVRAARPWPDTSFRIGVFSDQLPNTLTAAQRQFAATNLAGTQKMLRDEIRALRTYNTNFLCLHYQLAVGCGEHAFVDGNAWTSDWAVVNSQANWFLINPQGQRVHQTGWDWDVMNITYSNSIANTAFPQYWITTCLARIKSAEDDGVFADSFTQDAYSFGQCDPSHPWLEDVTACQTGWVPNLERFGAAVKTAFDTDTNGFLFLPNLGGLLTGWDPMNYGVGHGGMIEGFCFWDSWNPFDPDDWTLQMNRALALVRSNKVLICQSYPETWDYTGRMFAVTSYLLIKGSKTYLNLLTTGAVALEYYPEYRIDLGGAFSNAPSGLTNLWSSAWRVYRRDFTNGIALVNPSDTPVTINNLGTNYQRVTATGGGAVDSSGQYGGSLSLTSVTSLTLSARSGAVLMRPTAGPSSLPSQPSGLAVFHRSGQTFITWMERPELTAEQYNVYRHTAPITSANLAQATRLYRVPEGSGRFYANRYDVENSGVWSNRYINYYVITNNGPELAPGTGLLVWTLATNDFAGASTGSMYYAVTTTEASGLENTTGFYSSNTVGPIAEGVSDPRPVQIRSFSASGGGGAGHVMIQFMDLRSWNPTFHAPHARDNYYGLDSGSYAVTSAIQYAYDYVVIEPSCADSPAPLYMNLHGYAGNSYGPVNSDPEPYSWCAYKIYPIDQNQTWYFGFARSNDYRTGSDPGPGDTIVNYTEQRLLRMVRDTIRWPPGSAAVDTNRVYVWGHSMGGSGTLALALRYPNVFAAASASQPMTDYSRSGEGGGADWRGDVEWKWGSIAQNLPVSMDAPGGWASHLSSFNGTGVWDWQNHQQQMTARAAEEFVPLGIGHGINDTVIEWSTQGRPAYSNLDAARICWGARVDNSEHSWMGFDITPPTLQPDMSLTPFQAFSVRRNESVPGLSRCSANGALPPDAPAYYNHAVEWSASWYNWDGAPTDQSNLWQMSFRSLSGSSLTVDVTSRRLQAFPKKPGQRVFWQNVPVSGGGAIQQDTLAADGHGLINITNFVVSTSGNRLRMVTDGGPDSNTNGIPDYWELAYFGGSTNAQALVDSDGDHVNNLNEYRAGTDPLVASSRFVISSVEPHRIGWLATPGFQYTLEFSTNAMIWQSLMVVTSPMHQAEANLQTATNKVQLLRVRAN